MVVISILSQKGGAGKTTLAINLAIAAELDGKSTVILDLDPQASASNFGDMRESESPVIMSIQAARLNPMLETAKENGADIVVIDTAPHSESDALAAAKLADIIVTPCRPSVLDLQAIRRTADLVDIARKPAMAVLNSVPHMGKIGDEAEEALSQYNFTIAPTRIIQRAAHYHAFTMGQGVQEYEPNGKAAEEISALYKFVLQHVNMKTKQHDDMLA